MTRTAPQARPGQQDDGAPDPRRWKALAVCLVGGFMVLLDVSIVNVARIAGSRGRDFASAYTHALGIALVFVGAALLLAVVDVVVDRRISRRQEAADRSGQRAGVPAR